MPEASQSALFPFLMAGIVGLPLLVLWWLWQRASRLGRVLLVLTAVIIVGVLIMVVVTLVTLFFGAVTFSHAGPVDALAAYPVPGEHAPKECEWVYPTAQIDTGYCLLNRASLTVRDGRVRRVSMTVHLPLAALLASWGAPEGTKRRGRLVTLRWCGRAAYGTTTSAVTPRMIVYHVSLYEEICYA